MISDKITQFDRKIETERISIQRKFEKLLKELNIDYLIEKLELKLNAQIFELFKEQCEIKLKGLDKKSKINEKSITQLEKFVENLALAISSMERKSHEVIVNPAATQQQYNPICLS